jgi:hypothetical protein
VLPRSTSDIPRLTPPSWLAPDSVPLTPVPPIGGWLPIRIRRIDSAGGATCARSAH